MSAAVRKAQEQLLFQLQGDLLIDLTRQGNIRSPALLARLNDDPRDVRFYFVHPDPYGIRIDLCLKRLVDRILQGQRPVEA